MYILPLLCVTPFLSTSSESAPPLIFFFVRSLISLLFSLYLINMPRNARGRGRGGPAKGKGKEPTTPTPPVTPVREQTSESIVSDSISANCNVTGQLASQEQARDIKFVGFSLSSHGVPLIADTTLELNFGRRYGLIGRNGSGKSTFLQALGSRELPIPKHIDIYLLQEEVGASDQTAMEAVIEFGLSEVRRLEKQEHSVIEDFGPDSPILLDIYDRLDELVC
jgi:hypothetical protein